MTKSLRTLASEFTRARDGYAVTLSDKDRQRARKALWKYLKAGGRIGFGIAQEKSA